MPDLRDTAASMVAPGKGVLAEDDSVATMSKRLAAAGIRPGETVRRDYRELLLTDPGLAEWVSGVSFCGETLRQRLAGGPPFAQVALERGIQAGITVDTGVTALPFAGGATVTEGLDGARGRLAEYREMGAAFAKWRGVLDPDRFSLRAAAANAHALARYAALCQEAGLVSIVEPEVLMDGPHDIGRCEALTAETLAMVFEQIDLMGADPAGMVLKPNMVVDGTGSGEPGRVAEAQAALAANCARASAASYPGDRVRGDVSA